MIPRESPRNPREALPVFLAHGSPRVLLAAFALALVARIAVGTWRAWDLAPVLLLLAIWPLQEWLLHVFVLHWRPREIAGRTLDFAVPRAHRAHHRDPGDREWVFIPLRAFVYALPLLGAAALLLAPTPSLALTALVAYLALALHYEWVHFLVHTRWRPRTAPYRALWRHHRLHHFKNEHYWFGVTRRGGDHLLGTAPDRGAVPTSPTCRSLGSEEDLGAARS